MARKLRSEGLSVREIETRLGVARSSVSLWVRDVELSDAQREALRTRPAW
jgi:transposase